MLASELQDKSVDPLTATIASSGTVSDAVLLYGCTAIGFETPAALTGTTFTFQGSIDNGTTFVTIKDQLNTTVSYTVSVDSAYALDATIFAPYDQIKVVSGSSEGAERLIKIKPFAL
ncbi:MAG: hypothetical protein ACUZ8H_03355 [Candidatus Anammoxibacter sp.]